MIIGAGTTVYIFFLQNRHIYLSTLLQVIYYMYKLCLVSLRFVVAMEIIDTHICGACKREFTNLDEFQAHKRQCLSSLSLACEPTAQFKTSLADPSLPTSGAPSQDARLINSVTRQLVSDQSGVLVGSFVEFSGVEFSNGDGKQRHENMPPADSQVLTISQAEVMQQQQQLQQQQQQQQQLVLNNVVLGLPNSIATMATTAPSSTDSLSIPTQIWQNGQMIEQMSNLNSTSAYANNSLTTIQAGVAGSSGDVVNTIQIAVAPGNNLTIMPGPATSHQLGVLTNGHNAIPIFQNLQTYSSYKDSGWL